VTRAARAILACALAASAGGVSAKQAAEPSGPYRFECSIALLMPDGRFTDSAAVTISFVADRATLRDIHVVDPGGILFPGGNFRFVHKPDVISMEAVEMPAERPGQWSGTVEKKMYRLTLASPSLPQAVTIGLGRTPAKSTGRYGLVWNASHQPEGSPRPISGSGGGNCALGQSQETSR
jgi:hypothetical protein